jgi:MFS family permease
MSRHLTARLLSLGRWLLGYEGIPYLSRGTFRLELISGIFAAAAGGVLLPEFSQLFALKTLNGPDWLTAVIVAEAAIGNLLGSTIAQHLQRRRQVPYIVAARLGVAAAMAVTAALPGRSSSLTAFTLILLVPALLMAVGLTAQSSIWQSNYPEQFRGKIYARLSAVRLAALVGGLKTAGWVLDAAPAWGHHAVFAAAAAMMAASALIFSRVRVRGERMILRQAVSHAPRLLAGFAVLRHDREYRQYMTWQMVSGGSLLMIAPVVVPALKDAFPLDYAPATTALFLVPFVLQMACVPVAGWFFDRINIMHYRTVNAALWAASRALIYVALLLASWPLVLAGYALQGVAQASGDVVWNIGHTRFAPQGQAQLYMGVHMSLQGIRGLTLPFLGMWLYHMPQVGLHVMAAAMAMQVLAAFEFFLSAPSRQERAGAQPSRSAVQKAPLDS